MNSLNELAKTVMDCKWYETPTIEQATLFLVSEVGEAADALSRSWSRPFVRNSDKSTNFAEELADVVIMAAITARVAKINLDYAMSKKLDKLLERFGGHDGSSTDPD